MAGIELLKRSSDWEKYLSNNKFLVANFTAHWCSPCQVIKPHIDDLYNNDNFKKIEIVRIDLDHQQELAAKLDVTSIPTFIFFEDGKEVKRISGANIPAIDEQFEVLGKKANEEHGGGRASTGVTSAPSSNYVEQVKDKIPKGFELLNGTIYYPDFEALNALSVEKGGEVKDLFRTNDSDTRKTTNAVMSDADSQVLFFVPFTHLSKVYSILLKVKTPTKLLDECEAKGDTEFEISKEEADQAAQLPSNIKIWINNHTIMSFEDASTSSNTSHSESVEPMEDGWYECRLRFVRFQSVQSLNIFLDGQDEDAHTIIEKILIVGVNGESLDQGTVQGFEE